jgi:hypothetical protein
MDIPDEANQHTRRWSNEASALAAQARVLSGEKFEQLVVRLQRQTGRSHQDCWRFVIEQGIKGGRFVYRRRTREEVEPAREGLVKQTVDDIAKKLKRSPRSVRSMLQRHSLRVREIRCDSFSAESLASALRVSRQEVVTWIARGWLQATVSRHPKFNAYTITPEALALAYENHLADLLQRGVPNQRLFEAYIQYLHSSKHSDSDTSPAVGRNWQEMADGGNEKDDRREVPDTSCEDDVSQGQATPGTAGLPSHLNVPDG